MGVSKRDWKDFQSKVWLGDCKSTRDDLDEAFGRVLSAADGGDAHRFAQAADEIRAVALTAENAAITAGNKLRDLQLEGNQRRFANRTAIGTSDAAIRSVQDYQARLASLSEEFTAWLNANGNPHMDPEAAERLVASQEIARPVGNMRIDLDIAFSTTGSDVAALANIAKIGII